MRKTCVCLGMALLVLLAMPVAAAERVQNGADLWVSDYTFTSFKENPLPAGFFCAESKAFKGVINMQGEPLATAPAGALGKVDTIVRRLDDTSFNQDGEATTRIRLMALSLKSVKPVETGCGLYDVTASLAGEQPVTEMKIARTSDNGGYYVAPLELNVKVVFTPVSGQGESREIMNHISLGPGHQSYWSWNRGAAAKVVVHRTGTVKVDTDGDRVPDSLVPAPGNFVAGVDPAAVSSGSTSDVKLCEAKSCHCSTRPDPYVPNWYCKHLHCTTVWVDCSRPVEEVRYGPIPEEDADADTAEPIRN